VGGLVNAQFGTPGLLVTAGLAGFVFSAGGTIAVFLLCWSEGVGAETAMLAVLSVAVMRSSVKIALTTSAADQQFSQQVVFRGVAHASYGCDGGRLVLAISVATTGIPCKWSGLRGA
jgi:uncharacterized membrane protein (DUF4010 family)